MRSAILFLVAWMLPFASVKAQNTVVAQLLDSALCDGFYLPAQVSEADTLSEEGHLRFRFRNTQISHSIQACASGKVLAAESSAHGKYLIIEHRFVENGRVRTISSCSWGLDTIFCSKGQEISSGQEIAGARQSFCFEIRKEKLKNNLSLITGTSGQSQSWYDERFEKPRAFVSSHRQLLVPAREDTILIAVKSIYRIYLCRKGKIVSTYPIALGQSPAGHKQQEGDNKTPEGEYRIIQKSRGPFTKGAYAAWLGDAWMRINYPSTADAEAGFRQGKISRSQLESIRNSNASGKEPLKTTKLGGGIGIHGWNGTWTDNGQQNLTWGCISINNDNLVKVYAQVAVGTALIIHP